MGHTVKPDLTSPTGIFAQPLHNRNIFVVQTSTCKFAIPNHTSMLPYTFNCSWWTDCTLQVSTRCVHHAIATAKIWCSKFLGFMWNIVPVRILTCSNCISNLDNYPHQQSVLQQEHNRIWQHPSSYLMNANLENMEVLLNNLIKIFADSRLQKRDTRDVRFVSV